MRTSSEAAGLASAVVSEIHAVDPDVVVYGIRTMQDRLYDSLARQRFSSTMLGAFAAFALLLAAIGLYGVMSHLVTQGTHDIGVLVALGARPGNIVGLVVRQGMELAGIGIVVGLAAAAALTRVMASLLFGVSATDCAYFRCCTCVVGSGGVCGYRDSGMAGDESGSDGGAARGIAALLATNDREIGKDGKSRFLAPLGMTTVRGGDASREHQEKLEASNVR